MRRDNRKGKGKESRKHKQNKCKGMRQTETN